MTRKEKRDRISKSMNLSGVRLKDFEIDRLLDLVTNPAKYDGRSKARSKTFEGWSSDGRYTAKEKTTFTIRADEGQVCVEENYLYEDDDGETRQDDKIIVATRAILKILNFIFGD